MLGFGLHLLLCFLPCINVCHALSASDLGFGATIRPAVEGAEDMIYFTISFGFPDGEDRAPSQREVEEVICVTNPFILGYVEDYMSNILNETRPLQLFATNIDWRYHRGGDWPIEIMFTADASYAVSSNPEQVYKEDVFKGFDLTVDQVVSYITDWVWQVSRQSIFLQVNKVHFNLKRDKVRVTAGQLQEANCLQTRVPTVTPVTPSAAPTPVFARGDGSQVDLPTVAPSLQGTPPADDTRTTLFQHSAIVDSPMNGTTLEPAQMSSPSPTEESNNDDLLTDPNGNIIPISVEFLVSNLVGIKDPDDVMDTWGLTLSWPVLVQNLIQSLPPQWIEEPEVSEPTVEYVHGTAKVASARQINCGPYAHRDSTCHQVIAKYDLALLDWEDASHITSRIGKVEMKRHYQVETYQAINDGTYYGVLKRLVPSTVLYIGTIPQDSGHGAERSWFLVLAILMGILCACVLLCICHRCWIQCQDRKAKASQKGKKDQDSPSPYLSTVYEEDESLSSHWEGDDDHADDDFWQDDDDDDKPVLSKERQWIRHREAVRRQHQAKRLQRALVTSAA